MVGQSLPWQRPQNGRRDADNGLSFRVQRKENWREFSNEKKPKIMYVAVLNVNSKLAVGAFAYAKSASSLPLVGTV